MSEDNEKQYEIHAPPDDKNPDPRGLASLVLDCLEKYKDKISQVDAITGESQTYEEIKIKSIRVAVELRKRGITNDDVVSICSGNHLDVSPAFLGTIFMGAKPASVVSALSKRELNHLLNLVQPKIIFVEQNSVEHLEESLIDVNFKYTIIVFGKSERYDSFDRFLEADEEAEKFFKPYQPANLKENFIIFFSSGTTGLPKGIVLSHYAFMWNICTFPDRMAIKLNRAINYSPVYWISGVGILIGTILKGGLRVIMPPFTEESFLSYIEKYQVTSVFTHPGILIKCAKKPELFETHDTSSLSTILITGAPISTDYMKTLRNLFSSSTIMSMYAMTEASGPVTLYNFDKDKKIANEKVDSSGYPIPGVSYRIVDLETGKTVGPNQSGELRIKIPSEMNGYYNNPEESKKAWDEKGWLITGDVAYYDEDRCFYFVDRTKEMLKYQGYHITPSELELLLVAYPGVKEALVIGIPDKDDGDHPMAVIIKNPGANIKESEIIKYVNDQVSDPKKLRGGVKFVDSILTTVTGKYKRKEMKDLILKGFI